MMKSKVWALIFVLLFSLSLLPQETLASDSVPFTLAAPENLTVEIKMDQNNWAYFAITMDVPESVRVINENLSEDFHHYSGANCLPTSICFESKYGDYDWNEGPSLYTVTDMAVSDLLGGNVYGYYPYEEEDADGGINVDAEVYSFRAYFYSPWGYINSFVDKKVQSHYSNLVVIGNPAAYRGASDWAIEDLDQAVEYGFISERVKDDVGGFITREEFAELAVQMYELYTAKQAEPAPIETFTDTDNPEILKAHALGIVAGIGNNEFAPDVLINREQMAAMLYRSVETLNPAADMSVLGAPVFSDEQDIAPYFVTNVKFVAKHDFLTGVGSNEFAPKAFSTREQAIVAAVRIFDAYTQTDE
ncbi:MAG: S-layer homology domain-containing protein [Limnochordia bacterium]|nr:S-layer homology domain-containing protein [Limnochordia bacterium]